MRRRCEPIINWNIFCQNAYKMADEQVRYNIPKRSLLHHAVYIMMSTFNDAWTVNYSDNRLAIMYLSFECTVRSLCSLLDVLFISHSMWSTLMFHVLYVIDASPYNRCFTHTLFQLLQKNIYFLQSIVCSNVMCFLDKNLIRGLYLSYVSNCYCLTFGMNKKWSIIFFPNLN